MKVLIQMLQEMIKKVEIQSQGNREIELYNFTGSANRT